VDNKREVLRVENVPPEAFPDGTVECHTDGGGVTVYRALTRAEFDTIFARYNADRQDA
jgi:hypothetical protein